MRPAWRLERGANPLENDSGTRFSVWAPAARTLAVVPGPGEAERVHPLDRSREGVFEGVIPGLGPGDDYRFRLDGERDRADPVSRWQPSGVHGPSRIVDPAGFEWSDADWTGLDLEDLVFYELHVGTFTDDGTFEAVIERLDYLRELGVTALQLMPVAQFPGRRNWGYDGVFPYAPQTSYGGPDGLRRLVDAAHARGLGVFLDVVYNHLGPEGNYLREYGPYFTDRYETPWGDAVNFDGPESDQIRRYFIENALCWITEYHVDGLRLDAVHAIYDFSALHILEELAAAVHEQAASLGRRVQVIAESDLNDPRLVRERSRGGYGLDAQWSDDFHHAVHAALTGEREGYYVDFGGPEPVAKALSDRFVLDGRYSAYRRRRHGASAGDLSARRFVIYIQNHDQVGNRARGDRLSTLVSLEARKLAAATALLSPYVPLLFTGEEYGETNPFLYFVDHGDPDLVRAVREGRRREFASFGWEGPIPDPAAPETFDASRPRFDRLDESPHAEQLLLYRDLLRIRRQEPALRPGLADVSVDAEPERGLIGLTYRISGRPRLLAGFNYSGDDGELDLDLEPGVWNRTLATDERRYAGPGTGAPDRLEAVAGQATGLPMAGHSAILYRMESA